MKKLSDREVEIMQIIWKASKPICTGSITKEFNTIQAYPMQSIQVYLRRLCVKGALQCSTIGHKNYYVPLFSEDDYKAYAAGQFARRLFNDSRIDLLVFMIRNGDISLDEVEQMKKLISK